MYKNTLFFLINKNSFQLSFFFLKYFNFYSLKFINNSSKNITLKKNFNFNFNFYSNNLVFKYFKYFNKIILFKGDLFKKNSLNYLYNYKKNTFYNFNNNNYKYFNRLSNLILEINKSNYNFLILDKSYKNIFPLYNYIFKLNNLLIYKKYFFIKSSFFTYIN